MNRFLKPSLLALAGILLSASTLGAEDLKWGLQFSLAQPVGDLKDLVHNQLGGDLKGFCLVDLGNGHSLRPGLDLLGFSGKDGRVSTSLGTVELKGAKATVSMASLGADYLYFFSGSPSAAGPYVGAGAAVGSNKVELTKDAVTVSHSSTRLSHSLVAGYQFNAHWNAEVSYRYSNWKSDDLTLNGVPVKVSLTLPAYLVGAGYRF